MEAKSILSYYQFGTGIRYLQDASKGHTIHGESYILDNMRATINHFDTLGLQVTRRAAREFISLGKELSETEKDAKLTAEQASKLSLVVTDLRKTLEAEVEGFEAFLISPKRIDTKKLLECVEELFSPNVFDEIPEIARYDFEQAGKCIAFELPTSAAFHILRGTESVLRHFYCDQVKQKRGSMMWGPIIVDLRKRTKTKKHTTLINNLENIKNSFRNPTQHPEKIYDIQEAQDLLSLCIDVINRMIKVTTGEAT